MRECFIMKGYISNQVTMIVLELSSNNLKLVIYCGKFWSTFVDQMVLFKKYYC